MDQLRSISEGLETQSQDRATEFSEIHLTEQPVIHAHDCEHVIPKDLLLSHPSEISAS